MLRQPNLHLPHLLCQSLAILGEVLDKCRHNFEGVRRFASYASGCTVVLAPECLNICKVRFAALEPDHVFALFLAFVHDRNQEPHSDTEPSVRYPELADPFKRAREIQQERTLLDRCARFRHCKIVWPIMKTVDGKCHAKTLM